MTLDSENSVPCSPAGSPISTIFFRRSPSSANPVTRQQPSSRSMKIRIAAAAMYCEADVAMPTPSAPSLKPATIRIFSPTLATPEIARKNSGCFVSPPDL